MVLIVTHANVEVALEKLVTLVVSFKEANPNMPDVFCPLIERVDWN